MEGVSTLVVAIKTAPPFLSLRLTLSTCPLASCGRRKNTIFRLFCTPLKSILKVTNGDKIAFLFLVYFLKLCEKGGCDSLELHIPFSKIFTFFVIFHDFLTSKEVRNYRLKFFSFIFISF